MARGRGVKDDAGEAGILRVLHFDGWGRKQSSWNTRQWERIGVKKRIMGLQNRQQC